MLQFGTLAGSDPDELLADDFQFVAPIVGPLGKREFLNAFGSFKVERPFLIYPNRRSSRGAGAW